MSPTTVTVTGPPAPSPPALPHSELNTAASENPASPAMPPPPPMLWAMMPTALWPVVETSPVTFTVTGPPSPAFPPGRSQSKPMPIEVAPVKPTGSAHTPQSVALPAMPPPPPMLWARMPNEPSGSGGGVGSSPGAEPRSAAPAPSTPPPVLIEAPSSVTDTGPPFPAAPPAPPTATLPVSPAAPVPPLPPPPPTLWAMMPGAFSPTVVSTPPVWVSSISLPLPLAPSLPPTKAPQDDAEPTRSVPVVSEAP